MKDFFVIIICFFAFLCIFMISINYTGTFWVKVFKVIYKFIEKYWFYIIFVFCFLSVLGILINFFVYRRYSYGFPIGR